MKRANQKIQPRNKPRFQLRFSTIFVLCIMVAVVGSSSWQIWQLRSQVEGKLAHLNQEKRTLLEQEKVLRDEIALLNTDRYIEKLAREKLGLVKRGEILISPKN